MRNLVPYMNGQNLIMLDMVDDTFYLAAYWLKNINISPMFYLAIIVVLILAVFVALRRVYRINA